ncbi:MAG: hypothetical protein JJ960_18480 [Kordiimonadaceae bacterium]|nr:hypothetical protein [Kordiimonadaceae bacterium]
MKLTPELIARQRSNLYADFNDGKISWEEVERAENDLVAQLDAQEIVEEHEKRSKIASQIAESRRDWRAWRRKLPAMLTDREYSDAEASALEALLYLTAQAGEQNTVQIPVKAIAAAGKVSERTVRYMLSKSEALGHIHVEHIKIGPRRHAPSRYHIIHSALVQLVRRIGNADPTAKRCNESKITILESTSSPANPCKSKNTGTPPSRRGPKAQQVRHERAADAARTAWQSNRGRGSARVRPSDTERVALKAIELLELTNSPDKPWPEVVEELRKCKYPDIHERYWESRLRLHGSRAYLALLETELKATSQTHKPIHNPTKYLLGILKKPPVQCRPEVSLEKIMVSA